MNSHHLDSNRDIINKNKYTYLLKNNIEENKIDNKNYNLPVDILLQDDAYYKTIETPLKPAAALKYAHKKELLEFFQLPTLEKQIKESLNLVYQLLPSYASAESCTKIKEELEECPQHFTNYSQKISREHAKSPLSFQQMLGLTDKTLLIIYDMAYELIYKGNFKEAELLLIFLTLLAPHVPSYWIARGVCLQALDVHAQAVECLEIAKQLNPSNPVPCTYLIDSWLQLKENDKAQAERETLLVVISQLSTEEQQNWIQKIRPIHNLS